MWPPEETTNRRSSKKKACKQEALLFFLVCASWSAPRTIVCVGNGVLQHMYNIVLFLMYLRFHAGFLCRERERPQPDEAEAITGAYVQTR